MGRRNELFKSLIKKDRGRHIYDILFMLSNRYSVNKNILRVLGIKKEFLEVIAERIKKLSKEELKKQAEILRPFLFDESEANLIINVHNIIPPLVEQYKNSVG